MKTAGTAAIAGIACLGAMVAAAPVKAQDGPHLPGVGGPSSFSAGVYLPSSGEAKDSGNTQLNLNYRYTLPVENELDVPARTVLDLGAQIGATHGKHNTIIPVTVGEVIGLNGKSPAATGNAFAGVGVGAYFMNQSGLSSAVRLGGYGELGYNISDSLFVDGRYQFVQHGNGAMINLGYRF